MKKYLTIRLEDATSNYEENDTKYKDASLRLSKLGQDVDYVRKLCLSVGIKTVRNQMLKNKFFTAGTIYIYTKIYIDLY